jgi:hypothetical protein
MRSPTPAQLAHTDARRLAIVLQESVPDSQPVAGGTMACDAEGSWARYAAGLGVSGPVTVGDIDTLIAFYQERGATPEVQTTPYQHPSLFEALATRGLGLADCETILFRSLRDALPTQHIPEGFHLERVDPCQAASVARFVEAHLEGFHPGRDHPAALREIAGRVARNPRVRLWTVHQGERCAGSAGYEHFEGTATLIAGSVQPWARRRGVQQWLIAQRLAAAAAEGLTIATVGSTPGGPTERNAWRAGFQVGFTQMSFQLRQGT